MRIPNYLSPGLMFFNLIMGLIVGTLMFKVVLANQLEDIIKDFPTNKAIAATGLVNVTLYWIWAKRQVKKDELEYRQDLQSSLDLLQQSEKNKPNENK